MGHIILLRKLVNNSLHKICIITYTELSASLLSQCGINYADSQQSNGAYTSSYQ